LQTKAGQSLSPSLGVPNLLPSSCFTNLLNPLHTPPRRRIPRYRKENSDIMTYGELDQLAINTIRILAVRCAPLTTFHSMRIIPDTTPTTTLEELNFLNANN
jgi:hypothetical protein